MADLDIVGKYEMGNEPALMECSYFDQVMLQKKKNNNNNKNSYLFRKIHGFRHVELWSHLEQLQGLLLVGLVKDTVKRRFITWNSFVKGIKLLSNELEEIVTSIGNKFL